MYISDLIKRSGRSIRSAKVRTLLTALAIAVGTYSLTLTLAASNGTQNFINEIIQDNFNPSELIVSSDDRVLGSDTDLNQPLEYDPSFGEASSGAGAAIQIKRITTADIQKIEALDRIANIRKDIAINLQYLTRDGDSKFIATVAPFDEYRSPTVLAGSIERPLDDESLLLPESWLESLGFSSPEDAVGQEVTFVLRPTAEQLRQASPPASENFQVEIEGQELTGPEYTYQISAVLERQSTVQPGTELYLFISDNEANRLNEIVTEGTDRFGAFNFIYVDVEGGENESVLREVQEEIRELGYTAQSVQDTQDFLNQIIAVLQGIVVAFGAIAVLASIFGIVNTMYISVLQRTREIGLLKALGMRSRDVGRLFRFEAAWIGFLGGVIGSILALITGLLLNPWISEQLELGEGNYLLLFNAFEVVALILVLIIISILAGWLPSRKAAKLDPIEALRTE